MKRILPIQLVLVSAVLTGAHACEQEQPPAERTLYDALGGEDALAALTTIAFEAQGEQLVHSEAHVPGELLVANTFAATIRYEHETRRSRVDERRDTQFPFVFPRAFVRFLRGDAGFADGVEGVPVFLPSGDLEPDKAAAHAWIEQLLLPHILVRRAIDGELRIDALGRRELDGAEHYAFVLDDGVLPVTALVDATSGRLTTLQLTVHDTLLCDQSIEVRFADWTTIGELEFPLVAEVRGYGGTIHRETRTAVELGEPIASELLDPPANATLPADGAAAEVGRRRFPYYQMTSAMGVPFSLTQHDIEAVALAPNVTLLTASHNSLVVEQADGLVLIEAPLDGDRSQAIIAWADAQFPGKPITHVISTHHHLDHAGGLRRFVAAGARIVAASDNAAFLVDEVFPAACTVVPDALAESPVAATVDSVPHGGSWTLADASHPVVVHHVDTHHAADMLLVELPMQGILFNSDLYNPLPMELRELLTPYFTQADILDLADGLVAHDLTPTTIVGGHGGVAPIAVFEADVAALRPAPPE
jgi:glyoxylase-like metal-dependent hydrolase (beta-lactamase superfamily II)